MKASGFWLANCSTCCANFLRGMPMTTKLIAMVNTHNAPWNISADTTSPQRMCDMQRTAPHDSSLLPVQHNAARARAQLTFTFTFTFICHPGKTHNHRSRGDTSWRAQTVTTRTAHCYCSTQRATVAALPKRAQAPSQCAQYGVFRERSELAGGPQSTVLCCFEWLLR